MISTRQSGLTLTRLKLRFVGIYIFCLIVTAATLVLMGYVQHLRAAETYARALRGALVNGDARQAGQILRPAWREGFVAGAVFDRRGRLITKIPGRGDLPPAWRRVRLRRDIPLDPASPNVNRLARLELTYGPRLPGELLIASALALAGLIWRAFELARRTLVATAEMARVDLTLRRERRVAEQIAHDIRSPLSALSLTLDQRGQIGASERALLAAAARRIAEIADDLAAPVPGADPDLAVVDVTRVTREVFAEMRAARPPHARPSLTLDVDDASPAWCCGNARDIARVISNLMTNAVEALESSIGAGRVTLEVRRRASEVEISVVDTGRGMSPENPGLLRARALYAW